MQIHRREYRVAHTVRACERALRGSVHAQSVRVCVARQCMQCVRCDARVPPVGPKLSPWGLLDRMLGLGTR